MRAVAVGMTSGWNKMGAGTARKKAEAMKGKSKTEILYHRDPKKNLC